MSHSGKKELIAIALIQFFVAGIFFLALRHRLGPLDQAILIDPAGLLQQRPWMFFNGEQLKQGIFPLWNPSTGFGQPHLANLQTAVFYPLNFIVYILGPNFGYQLWLFSRLWLGAFFLYLFLRKLRLEILPSLAGSLVWPLGGYGLWFMQLVDLNSQILLPLFLIGCHNLSERPRLKSFLLLALIGWLIILGGHPEPIFNSFVLGGLYFIFRLSARNLPGKEMLGRVLLAGFAGALSLGLALIVLLPFFNYFPRCWSLHGSGFGFFHLDISTVLSLFMPGYNLINRGPGKILVELLKGGASNVFNAGYARTACPGLMPGAGVIVMLLALAGLLRLKKSRADFSFFTVVLVFLLGLTYGLAPFRWLAFLPWFSSASNFKFYFSEIYFCLSLLTGLGLSGFHKRNKTISFLIFSALLLSLYFQSFKIKPYLKLGLKDLDHQEWIKEIQRDPESKYYRIAVIGDDPALPPNLALIYGLNDIASSDALFPKDYVRTMEELNQIEDKDLLTYFYPQYYFRLTEASLSADRLSRLASEAGVKWLVGKELSALIGNHQQASIKKAGDFEIISLSPGLGPETVNGSAGNMKRIFMSEAYDFRVGLWASLSGLIMFCAFWILRKRYVKKD